MRRAVLAALSAAIIVGMAWSVPATAHSALDRSSPADGDTVDAAPAEVWAEFTEPPAPSSHLEIDDACGRRVDNDDSRVLGMRITVGLDSTGPGRYLVRWTTVSLTDGHPAKGWFAFTVLGAPASCPGRAVGATETSGQTSPAAAGSSRTSPGPATAPASAAVPPGHDPTQHAGHVASGAHGGHDYDPAASIAAAVAGSEGRAPGRNPSGRSPLVLPGGLAVVGLGLAPSLVRRLRRC